MNNIDKMEYYKSKYFDEPLESSTEYWIGKFIEGVIDEFKDIETKHSNIWNEFKYISDCMDRMEKILDELIKQEEDIKVGGTD